MKHYSFFHKSVITVDLGSFETKIIEGKKSEDGIIVNKAFSFITPSDSYDNGYIRNMPKLLDATKEELKKNKLSSGTCHLSIKSTAIITREIPFPLLGDKEIEGLLKYQLVEYLPMDASKYIIQHKSIEKIMDEGKEKMNVLVVAIPKDIVDMHYNFIKELGLKPAVLDYQSNGVWKLLNFTDYINSNTSPLQKTIAAIDLGYNSTNITIINNGKVQTNRVIDIGGQLLDNNAASLIAVSKDELLSKKLEIRDVSLVDEGYSDYNRYVNIAKTSIEGIMDRIDKVFKYYISKQTDNEIEVLLLYGGLSKIQGLEKLFSNYFSIPAIVLDKVGKVNLEDDIIKYINCVGALIRDDEV